MICKNCGHRYDGRTVGFKTTCEKCNEYLHTCCNCDLYDPQADRCRSLTTEAIGDRKANNYCEEFVPNIDSEPGTDLIKEKSADDFKTLFGTEGK